MHTVKYKWSGLILVEFNDGSKEKAEAHERMMVTAAKTKTDEIPHAAIKTKTFSNAIASTSKADALTVGSGVLPAKPVNCIACEEPHPLWRGFVFRGNTTTQRAKFVAVN